MNNLRNFCQSFQMYDPIFDRIGEVRLKLYELYGLNSPLTFKNCSRKKFRRNK